MSQPSPSLRPTLTYTLPSTAPTAASEAPTSTQITTRGKQYITHIIHLKNLIASIGITSANALITRRENDSTIIKSIYKGYNIAYIYVPGKPSWAEPFFLPAEIRNVTAELTSENPLYTEDSYSNSIFIFLYEWIMYMKWSIESGHNYEGSDEMYALFTQILQLTAVYLTRYVQHLLCISYTYSYA